MRKSFFINILVLSLLFALPASSENWDDITDLDTAWDVQKPIANQDYDKVINALEEKSKAQKDKKKKKLFKKVIGGGNSLHSELNPDKNITEIPDIKPSEEGILVNVPVNLKLDGVTLERGYYKVFAERDKNKEIHIKFYQSQFYKGEVIATETQDDYGEEFIDFARLVPYDDNFVKLIFGSIDFNAYAYVPYID